uniref:CSON004400 protein n=1 Tax=Culicoides sonorensis TaxID=179676 RepID=A0A336LTL6_CULSO
MKIDAIRPLKSAPTRLRDKPKYIHCPKQVSNDVQPRASMKKYLKLPGDLSLGNINFNTRSLS